MEADMKSFMFFVLFLAAGLLLAAPGHGQTLEAGASVEASATTAPEAEASAATAEPAPAPAPAEAAPAAAPPPQKRGMSGKKLGLIIGGWITFGVSYIPALGWGAYTATLYGPSAVFCIPVFGPLIVGFMSFTTSSIWGSYEGSNEVSGIMIGLGVFFVFWGLIQGAGLSMAIAGHVIKDPPAQAMLKKLTGKNRRVGMTLAPMATREGGGLGLVGWF
jgi:hypothetical protein